MHFLVLVVGDNPEEQLKPFSYFEDNENAKWDYHLEHECLVTKQNPSTEVFQCIAKDVDWDAMELKATCAIVKDGQWLEQQEKQWELSEEWKRQFSDTISSLNGDELISVYDCHY